MNYAGTKIPAEFFCVTFVSDVEYVKRLGVKLGSTDRSQRKNQEAELAILDYASRVATRPPGDRRAHPKQWAAHPTSHALSPQRIFNADFTAGAA